MPDKRYGIIIFELNGEYYHHNIRDECYDDFEKNMHNFGMRFVASRRDITEGEIDRAIQKAKGLVIRLKEGIEVDFDKEF